MGRIFWSTDCLGCERIVWKFISPLMPDEAHLGPDGLSAYLEWPKGLELGKDTWNATSYNAP